MANAKKASKAAPKAKGAAKPKALDRERLARLSAEVQEHAGGPYKEDLVHRLEQEEGLIFKTSKGRVTAKMCGVEGSTGVIGRAEGELTSLTEQLAALTSWAGAARRACK